MANASVSRQQILVTEYGQEACLSIDYKQTPKVNAEVCHTGTPNKGGGEGAMWGEGVSYTLATHQDQTMFAPSETGYVVRRLTPTECERLQGFPDGWTDVPFKGSEHPSDTLRYKALGNSFAVPVVRWIGERIKAVEDGMTGD